MVPVSPFTTIVKVPPSTDGLGLKVTLLTLLADALMSSVMALSNPVPSGQV